jgi:hypothetical protein
MDSERKRKRRYTVSARVLAANRENLKKALAAHKLAPPPPPCLELPVHHQRGAARRALNQFPVADLRRKFCAGNFFLHSAALFGLPHAR